MRVCIHKHTRAVARKGARSHSRGEGKSEKSKGIARRRVGMRKGWSSLFRNPACSERKMVKEEVSFRGTSGLGKRLNFYQPPFRHASPPRASPRPAESSLVTRLEPRCNFSRWNVGADFSKTPRRQVFARYNPYRESLRQETFQLFRRDTIRREDNAQPALTGSFINIRSHSHRSDDRLNDYISY